MSSCSVYGLGGRFCDENSKVWINRYAMQIQNEKIIKAKTILKL